MNRVLYLSTMLVCSLVLAACGGDAEPEVSAPELSETLTHPDIIVNPGHPETMTITVAYPAQWITDVIEGQGLIRLATNENAIEVEKDRGYDFVDDHILLKFNHLKRGFISDRSLIEAYVDNLAPGNWGTPIKVDGLESSFTIGDYPAVKTVYEPGDKKTLALYAFEIDGEIFSLHIFGADDASQALALVIAEAVISSFQIEISA